MFSRLDQYKVGPNNVAILEVLSPNSPNLENFGHVFESLEIFFRAKVSKFINAFLTAKIVENLFLLRPN